MNTHDVVPPAVAMPPKRQAVTFEVSQVAPAEDPTPEAPFKEAVDSLLMKFTPQSAGSDTSTGQVTHRIEACSRYHGQLVADVRRHALISAVHMAFYAHRPLVLSPDMLWLMIAQGLANHVNANAEQLRPKFVKHSGRRRLAVMRNEFIKGSPENPWAEVLEGFSQQIREHIGEQTHDLLLPDFSTTGPAERAAAEIVLMDTLQAYFAYDVVTLCGIPHISLEGTPDDWAGLAERTRALGEFGLEGWTATLGPILAEFVSAAEGKVNTPFWQSIYRIRGQSGPLLNAGWIMAFFPYHLAEGGSLPTERNWTAWGMANGTTAVPRPPTAEDWFRIGKGPPFDGVPSGLSRAPFAWHYLDRTFAMDLLGGFVGISQDAETLALRPEIGWVVREEIAG